MRSRALAAALVLASAASAQAAGELSGFVAADARIFWSAPAFPGHRHRTVAPSLALQPEYRHTWGGGAQRLTLIPFVRLDPNDEERTHVDVRELSWLYARDRWDLLVGVGKVFWGVAESRHLVDIVNQTDLVEDPDEEDKLGQPMLRLGLLGERGTLTLFVLPRFRERTFPGRAGRLRGALPVQTDRSRFESPLREWHPDLAARGTLVLGEWDVGVAQFFGTSREPRLVPELDGAGRPGLIPHYDRISQTSLDAQLTRGRWLWKLEAIGRTGHGRPFLAAVAGVEYTLVGVAGTAADLGVLVEYLHDGRGRRAPATIFDDDVFLGVRVILNDPERTQLLAGALVDRRTGATILSVEASRRLSDWWTIALEGRMFLNVPRADPLFGVRRDGFLEVRLVRFF
jgi:hypothetical protein